MKRKEGRRKVRNREVVDGQLIEEGTLCFLSIENNRMNVTAAFYFCMCVFPSQSRHRD